MTISEAEYGLNIELDEIPTVHIDRMLAVHSRNAMTAIKEKVNDWIVEYLDIEGYPTEVSADSKEATNSDLVIGPILAGFKHKTRRKIRLEREIDIVSIERDAGICCDGPSFGDGNEVSKERGILLKRQ
ncbi:hypothetical protein EV426DRAFT_707822 [Tirmania nivea]|nr:hypothetical protein EV426DRAFT_707822 [Tirmania nivea]